MFKRLGSLCIVAGLPACLLADFSYEQSTKMTGGSMMGMMKLAGAFSKQAREPIQATVSVKGNRMLHWNKDHATVIDLDSETITEINFQKKQYSVMTFAEMTQAMERAMQQGKDKQGDDVKADLKVDIKSTGQSKQINGYDAKEMLVSMQMDATDEKTGKKGGMQILSSMWLAPSVAGYEEVREFHKKMAMKLAWTPGASSMMGARPDMARAMANVYKEGAKLDGIPLLQVMKMTPTSDGQPVTAPADAQSSQQQSKPKAETPTIAGALSGLGGFGGFGRKKKPAPAKEEPKDDSAASSSAAAGDSAVLMEMTTEMSGFSSAAVDPSKFAPPSGFKKVDNDMSRRQR